MYFNRIVAAAAMAAPLLATPVSAATFNLFNDADNALLGTFDAPAAGGLVISVLINYAGGVFDMLGAGTEAVVYDAVDNDLDGNGAVFGAVYNTNSFNASSTNGPVVCNIGECPFLLESSADPGNIPGEWYIEYLPANPAEAANISLGFYRIEPAAVPIPASIGLLALGGLALGAVGRRRRRAAT